METSIDKTLSSDINVITAEINTYKRIAGEAIFEIGRRLKHVKEHDLAHGEWERWLRSVEIVPRTARAMIQAYEQFGDRQTSTVLQVGKIFEMLSLPSDINRAEFVSKPHTVPSTGEVKTVDDMTVRQLREVCRAERQRADAERERADKAEADYETLRDTLESITEKPPEIEYARDDAAKDRLRRYEERFGDIEMYESAVFRIPNSTEISASLQTFGYEVRSLLKKYAFLAHYQRELHYVPDVVSEDYTSTLDALRDFSLKLLDEIESARHGARIINI